MKQRLTMHLPLLFNILMVRIYSLQASQAKKKRPFLAVPLSSISVPIILIVSIKLFVEWFYSKYFWNPLDAPILAWETKLINCWNSSISQSFKFLLTYTSQNLYSPCAISNILGNVFFLIWNFQPIHLPRNLFYHRFQHTILCMLKPLRFSSIRLLLWYPPVILPPIPILLLPHLDSTTYFLHSHFPSNA